MRYMLALLRCVFFLGVFSVLAACSHFQANRMLIHDRIDEYHPGYSVASLKMPAGVKEVPPDPYYVIPKIDSKYPVKVSILPPGSLVYKQEVEKHLNQPATAHQAYENNKPQSQPATTTKPLPATQKRSLPNPMS